MQRMRRAVKMTKEAVCELDRGQEEHESTGQQNNGYKGTESVYDKHHLKRERLLTIAHNPVKRISFARLLVIGDVKLPYSARSATPTKTAPTTCKTVVIESEMMRPITRILGLKCSKLLPVQSSRRSA